MNPNLNKSPKGNHMWRTTNEGELLTVGKKIYLSKCTKVVISPLVRLSSRGGL